MGYKLILINFCFISLEVLSLEIKAKENAKHIDPPIVKNEDIILQIIGKCDQIIDKLRSSDNREYISIFEGIKNDFNKNQAELRLFLSGNNRQKTERIDQYLDKLSKYFSDLLDKGKSNLSKEYNNTDIEEIKNKYKKLII